MKYIFVTLLIPKIRIHIHTLLISITPYVFGNVKIFVYNPYNVPLFLGHRGQDGKKVDKMSLFSQSVSLTQYVVLSVRQFQLA